ncbi:protein spartin isoform X2 [Sitodiplosis mosellana]|uniref:protein spartin isoform X2 n=1 Tax=Sitodiplosis mosellana TaxID=263140 RepID=UPI002444C33C|nr:protein spartin isoform X2 [Sitodiplosis mosellana]XP_055306090.1 protein spartin isoform X2 [Sitodiplosis mosellana]XP_055306091.1 protein spartin isoform X2 [Sitodiplosis mosellana]
MELEWKETYDILKRKQDEVTKTLDLAKQKEEEGNRELALINYKLGITLIDEALATPVALPDDPDDVDETWHLGLKIVKVLKRTRGEVMHRIAILSPSSSESGPRAQGIASSDSNRATTRPRTFMELAEALQSFEYDYTDTKNLPSVLELLFSCKGVKLYHINENGEVTTADEASILRIVRLDQDLTQNLDATYFMQIIRSSAAEEIQREDGMEDDEVELDNSIEDDEDFDEKPSAKKVRENIPTKPTDSSLIYPLIPGVSPCFRTEYGAFIFPDIQSEVQGAAIGLVVPKSADEIVLEILEAILHGIVRQIEEEEEEEGEEGEKKRERRYASERISDNIVQGACFISNGLVKGTEQLGKLVSYTTPYMISKMNGAPVNAPPISNKVVNGIEMAKSATGIAVGVTSYVAGKVGSATVALGKFLAPHVHAQGSKLLSKSMGYSTDDAKDKMSGVLTVAAGAVEGFGTVYNGLEKSAGILGKNLSENSVKIVEHKYGPQAGNLAQGTFDTVGNMINLSQNMSLITPKGLAKKTMKGTGKAIIADFKPQIPKTNYAPAGSLYPDLTEFSKKLAQSN